MPSCARSSGMASCNRFDGGACRMGDLLGFAASLARPGRRAQSHCPAAIICTLGAMNQPMEPNPPKRLRGVIDAARLIHAFCEQKIGWGRIGVVHQLTIIAIAAYVLYNILRGIDFKEVAAWRWSPPSRATSCSPRCSSPAVISR